MTYNPAEEANAQKRKRIVDYWDTKMLCSLESSTSSVDPDLAYLDNEIENHLLDEILSLQQEKAPGRCLDVGAGYGRFALTFLRFYKEIVLLEAAPKIFKQLQTLWQDYDNVECISCIFEDFEDTRKYDLIFASGVLYLYDEVMVARFVEKCRSMLAGQGFLVLRDFVSEPQKVIPSRYVKGGFCSYRSPRFWHEAAETWGFELLQLTCSKPKLALLRNPRFLNFLACLRLKGWLRLPIVVNAALRFGELRVSPGKDVKTVFMVMRVL